MPKAIRRYFCLILLSALLFSCENQAKDFEVVGLSQNRSVDSDNKTSSTFSWKIIATKNSWQQGAYQILVSASEKSIEKNVGDYWDSGKITSSNQLYFSYSGKAFSPGEKYYWKVKVWTQGGKSYRWSKTESFIASLTSSEDWKAQWITYDYTKEDPMPLFRKTFLIQGGNKPVSARLFICGLGYYEAYLNGKKNWGPRARTGCFYRRRWSGLLFMGSVSGKNCKAET